MTLQELRERDERLAAVQDRLTACVEAVYKAREATQELIAKSSREDIRLRPLGAEGTSNGFHVRSISIEEVRDAVVALGVFTLSDLGRALGCSPAKAKVELKRVMHLVKPSGKFGNRQIYEYCAPEGPGAVFEAQQRLRVVERDDRAVRDPQDIKQSIVSSVQDKEVREAVREAISQGWELVNAGGRHPLRLVRDDCRPITIVSTPRSSGNAARAIRRQVKNAP